MPILDSSTLVQFVTRVFEAAHVPAEDAVTVANGLVGANLRGHDSHGVMRLPQYIDFLEKGEYQIDVDLIVEHEAPAAVVCDAQWGLGHVQAHRLLDMTLPRAEELGLAAGVARRCGHIGRLGEYAERAAADGLILLATVNNCGAGQRVAPPGGTEPRLGTNPLCIGVPCDDRGPIVLDFGTSVAAEGKVRVYHLNNQPVPEGWLLDPEGKPTTDASVLYKQPLGSILPMGGTQAYKGFGLAFVLDLLAGGLTGGRSSFAGAPPARGNNVVFLAIDPARFAGRDVLIGEVLGLSDYVRSTPRAAGVEAILLPGDPERKAFESRSRDGIPISDAHWDKLVEVARRLGAPVPVLA